MDLKFSGMIKCKNTLMSLNDYSFPSYNHIDDSPNQIN